MKTALPQSPYDRRSFFVVCRPATAVWSLYILGENLSDGKTPVLGGAGGFACPSIAMPEYRRRLPHYHPDGAHLFLTWRLWGSLPAKPDSTLYATPGHAFAAQDRVLGRRASGPLWLKDPQIAELVSNSILVGDCERHFYDLIAWVVMPNSLWQKSGQAECLPHQLCKLLNLLRWRRRFRLRSGSGRLLPQAANTLPR